MLAIPVPVRPPASRLATFVVLPAAVRFFQNFNSGQFNVLVQASQVLPLRRRNTAGDGAGVPGSGRNPGRDPAPEVVSVRQAAPQTAATAPAGLWAWSPRSCPAMRSTLLLETVPLYLLFELSLLVAAIGERQASRLVAAGSSVTLALRDGPSSSPGQGCGPDGFGPPGKFPPAALGVAEFSERPERAWGCTYELRRFFCLVGGSACTTAGVGGESPHYARMSGKSLLGADDDSATGQPNIDCVVQAHPLRAPSGYEIFSPNRRSKHDSQQIQDLRRRGSDNR